MSVSQYERVQAQYEPIKKPTRMETPSLCKRGLIFPIKDSDTYHLSPILSAWDEPGD